MEIEEVMKLPQERAELKRVVGEYLLAMQSMRQMEENLCTAKEKREYHYNQVMAFLEPGNYMVYSLGRLIGVVQITDVEGISGQKKMSWWDPPQVVLGDIMTKDLQGPVHDSLKVMVQLNREISQMESDLSSIRASITEFESRAYKAVSEAGGVVWYFDYLLEIDEESLRVREMPIRKISL